MMTMVRAAAFKVLAPAIASLALATTAIASDLPRAQPEEIGLSRERLARITETIESEVARKEIPGAVVLIARRGKIGYFKTFGTLNPATSAPMPPDALFRIYSMTKPITSVAAMILVEDGKIKLDDPVGDYLPQFRNVKVAVEAPGAASSTLATNPATRPITVQDLMRHTSGLTYGFLHRTSVQKLYAKAKVWNDDQTNAEFVDRIAQMPLSQEPGTNWQYGHSTDVLGRLVEVVSGKSLFEFERERILGPLEMSDTSFVVSDVKKHGRIAEPFAGDAMFGNGDGRVEFSNPRLPRKWESGGAGLVSTATDYARFLQMLLNGGMLEGRRILGSRTVSYLTADHLGKEAFAGYGWSLGFAVRREAGMATMPGSTGDYFWLGAGGTSFWVDPKENLLVIFMAQKPARMDHYHQLMRQLVYASIDD